MAPMTRSRADADGVPSPQSPSYYAQRASAGLIITEAAYVAPEAIGYPGTPGIYSDQQVAAWREVTAAVHARRWTDLRCSCGTSVGFRTRVCSRASEQPVAPSAIAAEGQLFTALGRLPFVVPRALELSEIAGLVEQFEHAAPEADEAGFDGVDIHAGNGYLIDQFLRDGSNRRTDHYGGSIATAPASSSR